MLRAIVAAIRGAMSHLARLVWVTVEVGGKLVSMLKLEPQFEYDVADVGQAPEPANAQVPAAANLDRVRALATELGRRPDMSAGEIMSSGVPAVTAAWLAGLDPMMLCRVSLASDADLADAIAGRRNLRGVYPHNEPKPAARREVYEDAGLDNDLDQALGFA